ncbi:hypothetical protein AAMO2058_001141500 [Amorphochlora amoebiformis]
MAATHGRSRAENMALAATLVFIGGSLTIGARPSSSLGSSQFARPRRGAGLNVARYQRIKCGLLRFRGGEAEEDVDREKLLKAVRKEGGKKGQDLIGMAEMGGMQYFCASVDKCDGEFDLLQESLNSMNKEVPKDTDEKTGGAGSIGKMLFSAGVKRLAIVAHVPPPLNEKVDASAWLGEVLLQTGGNGKIVGDSNSTIAFAQIPLDAANNFYPIKVKDEAIPHAIRHLKSLGVFPDRDDESSDIVYGDDDFPDYEEGGEEDQEEEEDEEEDHDEVAKKLEETRLEERMVN